MIKILGFLSLVALLFCSDQWIVVTTIQHPTPQLRKLSQLPGWTLVVVGDQKTPADWHLDHCEYLSPQRQLDLGYELASLLPWNHYCRKNIGYLFAIENGAKIIYETDDDTEPSDQLKFCPAECELVPLYSEDLCVNVYGYFGFPAIWPRGFPLEKISYGSHFQIGSPTACKVGIEQGVVNGNPDVDAIFRLTQDRPVEFDAKAPSYLPRGVFCPFNSQNTFFHKEAFFSLYLPSTVSMRVSDIWRGYIAQKLIWDLGKVLVFSGPNATQQRNQHCLIDDFHLELDLYLKGTSFVDYLSRWDSEEEGSCERMDTLFQDLIRKKFLREEESLLFRAWMRDLKRIKKW